MDKNMDMAFPLVDLFVKEEKDEYIYEENHYEHLEVNWCFENIVVGCIKLEERDLVTFDELKGYSEEECIRCGCIFNDRFSLLIHNLTHLTVPVQYIYECNECSACYKQKDELRNHIVIEHCPKKIKVPLSKQKRKCRICAKVYAYRHWHSHMNEVHGSGDYTCGHCSKSFKCWRYLNKHCLKWHIGIKKNEKVVKKSNNNTSSGSFKCNQCPSILCNKNALKTHTRNCHSQSVNCTICNSKLKSASYLHTHMRRVHYDDGKQHSCKYCGKKFKSPRYIRIHMKNNSVCRKTHEKEMKPKKSLLSNGIFQSKLEW